MIRWALSWGVVVIIVGILALTLDLVAAQDTPNAVATLDDQDGRFDVVFTEFQEEATYRTNILKVLRSIVNDTNRISYSRISSGNKGYLFGPDVIVRFKVLARTDAGQNTTTQWMDMLVRMMNSPEEKGRLTNINAKNVIIVPPNSKAPKYQVRTTWDLLYTLLMVAGGLFVMGIMILIAYKLLLMYRRQAAEQRTEKADKKAQEEAEDNDAAGEEKAKKKKEDGGGEGDDDDADPSSLKVEGTSTRANWDVPDDEEMQVIELLKQASSSPPMAAPGLLNVPVQQQQMMAMQQAALVGGGGPMSFHGSPMAGSQYATHAKKAAIDRRMDMEFSLPEDRDDLLGGRGNGDRHSAASSTPTVEMNPPIRIPGGGAGSPNPGGNGMMVRGASSSPSPGGGGGGGVNSPGAQARMIGNLHAQGELNINQRLAMDPELRMPASKVTAIDDDPTL